MARQQVVSFTVTCDVCGEEISEGDTQGSSQKISWEGGDYIVDMCARDQAALAGVLDQLRVFVAAGSEKAKTGRRRGAAGASVSRAKAKSATPRRATSPASGASASKSNMPAIRAWAQENGHQVGHRGRIPASVVAAYEQAQSGAAEAPAPKKSRSRNAAAVSA